MPWDQRKRVPHSKTEETSFKPQDSDLKTLSVPGNTTVSAFMKSVLDAADQNEALSDLGAPGAWTEYIRPSSTTLTTLEMNDSIINNYGQAAVNVIVSLPSAVIGLAATFVIATAQAGNIYAIKATGTDKIYLAGTGGADGGLIYIVPTIGASVKVYSFQTGAGAYDWIAEIRSGTWLEGALPYRVTTTGDKRITTTGDYRIIA